MQKDYDMEIKKLKKKAQQEKEDLNSQFKTYCKEIKLIYDKDKDELKKKLSKYIDIGKASKIHYLIFIFFSSIFEF